MKEFVEKLICRLEELKCKYKNLCDACDIDSELQYDLGRYYGVFETISIVNQVAEEYNNGFCEWKLDGVYLMCQHKTELFVSCLEDEKHRYKYCPICGKKIKVVE